MVMVSITVGELAQKISATIFDQDSKFSVQTKVTKIGSLTQAQSDWVSFFLNPKFINDAKNTKACAIITAQPISQCQAIQLIHPNPYAAMAEVSTLLNPPTHSFSGISPLAYIDKSANIHSSATIYPHAFIDKNTSIGKNTVIYPHAYIGQGCQIGEDTIVHANVSIQSQCFLGNRVIIQSGVVIGGDGFGFAPTATDIKKIPQLGIVIIEDDVEIGANTTIDRATFDQTIIKKGCKIDAQVHIGHNVVVGEWSMLCGQVGIAGSATIGSRCIAAGKAGISQGVKIGDRITLGATSAALFDLNEAGEYQGIPAIPSLQWKREVISRKKIADLIKKISNLEKMLLDKEKNK